MGNKIEIDSALPARLPKVGRPSGGRLCEIG